MIRYAHTNIVSRDWKRLAEFYTNTFGCKIIPPVRDLDGNWLQRGTGVQNAKLKGAHLLLPGHGDGGPTLEIFQYTEILDQEAIVPNKRGFGHIAFEVDNIEEVLEQLVANGGQRFAEAGTHMIDDYGQVSFVYARDPDGNLVELQNWKSKCLHLD